MLSEGELAKLGERGEDRWAEVGDVLFRPGDRRYPLIAIIEGAAGQTVFFTAFSTEPPRYIAVERLGGAVALDDDAFVLTGQGGRHRRHPRNERAERLRGRRCPLGLRQALRHRFSAEVVEATPAGS